MTSVSEISGGAEHGPLRAEGAHEHAFYLAEDADGDGVVDHLLIYCRLGFQSAVRRAMDRLSTLWVNADRGQAAEQWGISLEMICPPADLKGSRLLGFAREWVSVTPYMKPRYDRRPPRDFDAWVATYRQQIEREWRQQYPEMPAPTVEALNRSGQFVGPSDRNLELREFCARAEVAAGINPTRRAGSFDSVFLGPLRARSPSESMRISVWGSSRDYKLKGTGARPRIADAQTRKSLALTVAAPPG